MPRIRFPRRSSLQYWPRVRANRPFARIRNWVEAKDAKPVGFAGYKVGMTHAMVLDNLPNSMTKGEEISMPLTVIECPPLQCIGLRTYTKDAYGLHAAGTIIWDKCGKHVRKAFVLPKKQKSSAEQISPENVADVRLIVATQPHLTTIGKKKPEVFELGIGGKVADKLAYAKGIIGKEISVSDVIADGMHVDTHTITKGKGVQGPVQRHGVDIRHHKSEKTKRGPGSLGPWHGTFNWPVAHQGQHGYHQRTEFNKRVMKISNEPNKINPKSGWRSYGVVKNTYVLLKGSTGGPASRLITFTKPMRPTKQLPTQVSTLSWISQETK